MQCCTPQDAARTSRSANNSMAAGVVKLLSCSNCNAWNPLPQPRPTASVSMAPPFVEAWEHSQDTVPHGNRER